MSIRRGLWTLTVLGLLGIAAFCFSPSRLGPVKEYRIIAYLKYWHVLAPQTMQPDMLASDLRSKQVRVYAESAQSIGLLPPHPVTIAALRRFLDRGDVEPGSKDVAVWSLGELRVQEALSQLRGRIGNEDYDQENLLNAIAKIEGNTEHSFWPE